MPTYTQANRPLAITTPLGKDALLLTGFRGSEAISELFHFQLDLLADVQTDIRFDRLLGQSVTVELTLLNGEKRYFNGLINRLSEGARDDAFSHFRADLVPKLWLLTKKVRSRVFQQLSVPDILHQVLTGFDVAYEISGMYHPRDYCVQYDESDFLFVSRLMEEEGIYYFFKHADGRHQLVVTDVANQHPAVPGQNSVIYDVMSGGSRDDMRVMAWEKAQELRAGEYTLRDYCFELPANNLEVSVKTVDSVMVGKVSHKLNVGGNDRLEIYDYPGGYARRFDGIDRNGVARSQDLRKIQDDGQRTVRVRMEEEEARSLEISGASNCGHFVAGHKFTLDRHFDADGSYLLIKIEHGAQLSGYRSGEAAAFEYDNRFTCKPAALPYRPPRLTPKPVIAGIQTAMVVGPRGEEIFCDKYGRVKVQFHWDREGKKDPNSSCWLRVAQVWAGKGWGAFFWPRVGNEVVVAFEEGDPDQPIIVGSVYNAQNMPPFGLPGSKMLGGLKSASVRGHASENFNGVVFEDAKGHEHLTIHSERHLVFNAEFDKMFRTGRHEGERVAGARTVTVGRLPGGGGSGGGPDSLWPTPDPQAVLGVNSIMVYGGNFQMAVPLNVQLALGSNLQICVNPVAYAGAMGSTSHPSAPSPTLSQVLGSGTGGNMQFTIGTSTNFVMGQSVDINLGPKKIEIHVGDSAPIGTPCVILGWVFCGLIMSFVVAYGLIHDDEQRALLTLTFQVALQALLLVFMDMHKLYKKVDHTVYLVDKTAFKTTNDYAKSVPLDVDFGEGSWVDVLGVANLVGLWATPGLQEAAAELGGSRPDESSEAAEASGGGSAPPGPGGGKQK